MFKWSEENRRTRRKTLGARMRTNNKLNPHMTPGPGIEPGHIGGRRVLSPLRHPCSPTMLNCIGKLGKDVCEYSIKFTVRAQNEQMTLEGPDGFFQIGSRQPVRPYTCQLANAFFVELRQRGGAFKTPLLLSNFVSIHPCK